MRLVITLLVIICFTVTSYAESFSQYNSASRTAIVLYTPDAQGFYHKQTNVSVNNVNNIEAQYAFDKKTRGYMSPPRMATMLLNLPKAKRNL